MKMFYNYGDENNDNAIPVEPENGQDSVRAEEAREQPDGELLNGAAAALDTPDETEECVKGGTWQQTYGENERTDAAGVMSPDAGVRAGTWSEPNYSQAPQQDAGMYTPGLNNRQYYARRRPEYQQTPNEEPASGGGRRGGFFRAACLALVCVLLSGAATYGVMEYRIKNGDLTVVNQVVLGGTGGSGGGGDITAPVVSSGDIMAGEDIYDMACSQVVGVKTEVEGYFGQQGTSTAVSGSGFVISTDGYILTNYHVIEAAYKGGYALKAVLNDGSEFDAKIIGFEESNDVAVIKIEASGLNASVIGDSDSIRVGQKVYAVGNPFGELVYTMTEGIVSGLNRVVSVERQSISAFQLSAAVNSGNSGGPVYNDRGEVIGIVTAKFMSSTVEGIGFAIPINDAIGLALDLVENGYITGKAFMGISVKPFSQQFAEFFSSVEGAYVVSVTPDSAADKAGIKVGDIIIKLGDMDVTSDNTLLLAKNKFKAGDTTGITVWRSGEEIELTITFDEDTSWVEQQQGQSEYTQPRDGAVSPDNTNPYGEGGRAIIIPDGQNQTPELPLP